MSRDLPSHQFATLKDVANLANTSAATVSFVLNGSTKRYISNEMRMRVLDAADKLGYVKFGAASSLKGKKSGVIAVLSPQFQNHYFAGIFAAVEKAAHDRDYVLATLNTFDDPEREKHAINQMIRLRVDGFLIIPTLAGGVNTDMVRRLNVPCVVVERPLPNVEDNTYDFISSDNLDASYTLTKHALDMGHKKIALAYWQSDITAAIENLNDRRVGYVKAMQDSGLYDESLMFSGDITREDGKRITEEILKNKSVTSIVYAHYILAEGGIQYMRSVGIKAPDDISVSFLGAPPWTSMVETNFTHIIQPSEQVGKKAVETLFTRIEGKVGAKVKDIIPGALHIGSSVNDRR